MEFMETGLSDGGPESEADPTNLENASGEIDYNNGYEGNSIYFRFRCIRFRCKILSPTDFLCILYLHLLEESYLPPQQEFDFVNSVVCDGISNHKDKEIGITTLSFDLHEDLLWAGTKSGHVSYKQ